jgi:hypothetical protein
LPNVDYLDRSIGFIVQHGDLLDLNSLYDIADEFESAGQAIATRKHRRDSDDSDSDSSSDTGVYCRACRSKREKLGPTSIKDPEVLRIGKGLVKETRKLAFERNEQLRLVVLSDLLEKRLHDFVNIKFTTPKKPKTKRKSKTKTQHNTPPTVSKPYPPPSAFMPTSVPPPPSTLRRSHRIATQRAAKEK